MPCTGGQALCDTQALYAAGLIDKEIRMTQFDALASTRLKAVLMTARSSKAQPATGLQVIIDALEVIIPQVEELESVQPVDAVSPMDELKRKQQEAADALRRGVRDFKSGLAQTLRDAADALVDE